MRAVTFWGTATDNWLTYLQGGTIRRRRLQSPPWHFMRNLSSTATERAAQVQKDTSMLTTNVLGPNTFFAAVFLLVGCDPLLVAQGKNCGLPPHAPRVATGGARSMSSPPYPQVSLLGIDSVDGSTRIVIEMQHWPGDKRWFSSGDGGRNWEQLARDPCTSIAHYADPSNCIRSRADSAVLYRSGQSGKDSYLERSTNGGLLRRQKSVGFPDFHAVFFMREPI